MAPSAALRLRIGALELKNPVICAAGEHVLTEAGIRAGLRAGASVVIAKSINESQAARDQLAQTDYLRTGDNWEALAWHGQRGNILCRSGLQPRASGDWIAAVAGLDREARQQDAYVAASVILADLGAAVGLARAIEAAGIRLLEFNVGTPYADAASHGGVTTERAAAKIREQVARIGATSTKPLKAPGSNRHACDPSQRMTSPPIAATMPCARLASGAARMSCHPRARASQRQGRAISMRRTGGSSGAAITCPSAPVRTKVHRVPVSQGHSAGSAYVGQPDRRTRSAWPAPTWRPARPTPPCLASRRSAWLTPPDWTPTPQPSCKWSPGTPCRTI